jgi:O-antigen/teichoic acid export membrane protein
MTMGPPVSFHRIVAILAGATAASQLINIAALPLVARIFPADQVGMLSVALSAAMIAFPLVTLQLPYAIPQEQNDRKAELLAAAILILAAFLTVILGGLVYLFGPILSRAWGIDWHVVLTGLCILPAIVLYEVSRMLVARQGGFASMARQTVAMSLTRAVSQIVGGFAGGGVIALVAGEISGRLISLGLLWRSLVPVVVAILSRTGKLVAMLLKRRAFAFVATPSALLDNLGGYLPTMAIANAYGVQAAGHFFMAQRVVGLPIAMLVQASAEAVHVRGVAMLEEGRRTLTRFVLRAVLVFSLIGIALIIALKTFLSWVWPVVFGPEWEAARAFAGLMLVAALFQSIAGPLSRLLIVTGRQAWKYAFDVFFLLAGVAPLVVAKFDPGGGADRAILTMSIAQASSYLVYLSLILSASRWPVARAAS